MCRLQAGVSYEILSRSAEAEKIHHLYALPTNSMCLGVTTLIGSLPSHCWPQHFHFRHDERARVWPSPLAPSVTLTPVLGVSKSFPVLPFFFVWGPNFADTSGRHVAATRDWSQLIPDTTPFAFPGSPFVAPKSSSKRKTQASVFYLQCGSRCKWHKADWCQWKGPNRLLCCTHKSKHI